MDIRLSINSLFDSVFLINGKLTEGGEIIYAETEVVYITALPLSAVLLPYTVKLVGGCIKSNAELCKCYRLDADKYYLKLMPRHNYVYAVPPHGKESVTDLVEKFFSLVAEQKLAAARECLSQELNESIDDAALSAFFQDFTDIVADDRMRGLYFLIGEDGKGHLYNFIVKRNLIENIVEM